jgi:hypothetical protein
VTKKETKQHVVTKLLQKAKASPRNIEMSFNKKEKLVLNYTPRKHGKKDTLTLCIRLKPAENN